MASMALSSSAAVVAGASATARTNLASPFSGRSFKLPSANNNNTTKSTTSGGLKVRCMQVWPPYNNHKWETLSYLPTLKPEQILKQVDYLLRNKWVPCLEFDEDPYIKRNYHTSPGCYNGRYWIMWKLPMFGCNDSTQVVAEVNECSKAYPKAFIRVIGFDPVRQVQCVSFIVHKP